MIVNVLVETSILLPENSCLNKEVPLFFNLNVVNPTTEPPLVNDGYIIDGVDVVPIPIIVVTIPTRFPIVVQTSEQQFSL